MQNDLKQRVRLLPILPPAGTDLSCPPGLQGRTMDTINRSLRRLSVVLLLAITLALATTPGIPIAFAHTTVSANSSEITSMSMPSVPGHLIVVSLSKQWLYAYLNGQQVFNTAIMSGRPALPTPVGTFHVFAKLSPTTFYSPFPPSSPYWYAPTHINYALEFLAGGYFLHDSWWHSVYGPGTNGWHYDPQFGWQWGSHGCVAMQLSSAAWLYKWAPIGTTVQIVP